MESTQSHLAELGTEKGALVNVAANGWLKVGQPRVWVPQGRVSPGDTGWPMGDPTAVSFPQRGYAAGSTPALGAVWDDQFPFVYPFCVYRKVRRKPRTR